MMKNRIILEDVRIFAYHGVMPEENILGTVFIVNLVAETDFSIAMESDELEGTISYADLNDIVHQEMSQTSRLLEHVACRIIRSVYAKFPQVSYLKLKILKTSPPMKGEMRGAGIEVEQYF